jgi:hypothetical protein
VRRNYNLANPTLYDQLRLAYQVRKVLRKGKSVRLS